MRNPKRPVRSSLVAAAAAAAGMLSYGCAPPPAGLAARLGEYEQHEGFIDLYRDAASGRLYLAIEHFETPFLYQTSLARGVGSNDLGLDRGQLGDGQLVEFQRHGDKVLMLAHNLRYRARSPAAAERAAVEASFATSVLWGFEVETEADAGGRVVVDGTDFFLRDAHGIARRLEDAGEGSYTPEAARSAIYAPRTKAFPDNTEVEALVTYLGRPTGEVLETVAPDPGSITVHLHHSFIRLPDGGYEPLPYDPRAGLIGLRYGGDGFADYASPVGEDLNVRYARRHRLQKSDPSAAVSPAVEPIVYYVDRGAPEPIRSALIEGASWWNDAFAAAGYDNAFRVELLPEGADPMDVRYNVIQWVHRATRGWSYGASVIDPRSGEILKGHVTLGSLRMRQDYLIAAGLLGPYAGDGAPDARFELALARLRQLSAHEVGHTLGLAHNFAASTQGRTSVMDYPFPRIGLDEHGRPDLSDAYGTGVGAWDERAVLYAYQDFADGVDAAAARGEIVARTVAELEFVADRDARGLGTAHPDGNLWDNGADALAELAHLLAVRAHALERLAAQRIRPGRPLATMQEVLVPVYLLHRYQLRAAGKLLGGRYFGYALAGDSQKPVRVVGAARQRAALEALVGTLAPALLTLPGDLPALLPPRPPGFAKSRETFSGHTGRVFDPLAPAGSAAALTLDVLLEPTRAARLVVQQARDPALPGFHDLTRALLEATWFAARPQGAAAAVRRTVERAVLTQLLRLAVATDAQGQVRALALDAVNTLDAWLEAQAAREPGTQWRAHYALARRHIADMRDDPASVAALPDVTVPPGSPIGCGDGGGALPLPY